MNVRFIKIYNLIIFHGDESLSENNKDESSTIKYIPFITNMQRKYPGKQSWSKFTLVPFRYPLY